MFCCCVCNFGIINNLWHCCREIWSFVYPLKSYFTRTSSSRNMTSSGKPSYLSTPRAISVYYILHVNHSFIHGDLIPSVFSIDLFYKWLLMLYRVLLLMLTVEVSEPEWRHFVIALVIIWMICLSCYFTV